jgi:monovalent cation/hydrogen antiporter
VLASVTTGLYLGWQAPHIASAQMRLQGLAVWEILVFLLNATLFILIGLQLPVVTERLDAYTAAEVAGYSALVCAAVIATRFVWGFTVPYVIRALDRRPQQRERRTGARFRIVSSWSGMRGAVSLAAALALPLETDAGAPLPGRDLILFITFVLIFVTVVGQGLTLPALIRRLGLREDGSEEEAEELRARLMASRAALERLEELTIEDWVRDDTAERVRGLFEFRQRRFKVRAGYWEDEDGIEDRSMSYQRLMHELFDAQRQAIVVLRNRGEISADVMRRVERELDLEESRLEV